MAKRRTGPNLNGIFRMLFTAHPDWVKSKKNDGVLAQFAADHPEIAIDQRVKQAMANAKNVARKGGTKGTSGKSRRVAEMHEALTGTRSNATSGLQLLEDNIDDCLAMAKQIGLEQIGDVIKHLHRARNILVLKIES